MKKLIVVALLAYAATAQGSTSFGAPDCGSWVKAPQPSQRAWLLGFLSGINAMWKADDPLEQVSSGNQFIVWMDNYCQAHPLSNVADGGAELFIELSKRLQKK